MYYLTYSIASRDLELKMIFASQIVDHNARHGFHDIICPHNHVANRVQVSQIMILHCTKTARVCTLYNNKLCIQTHSVLV